MDDREEIPTKTMTAIRKVSSGHEPKLPTGGPGSDVFAKVAQWLNHPGVVAHEKRMFRTVGQSERLGVHKELQIYLCSKADILSSESGEQYLVLPDGETWAEWVDERDDSYKSNAIYIRKSYIEIAKLIDEYASLTTSKRSRMTLSGTSGTGKSFFIKYFVWHLLHPAPGVPVPDVIIFKHSQSDPNGGIYCYGSFYSVDNIESFVTSSNCEDLMFKRNAWIIYDGAPPGDLPHHCKLLVASSPGNLSIDTLHFKQHQKTTFFNLYLPPWSLPEILDIGRTIHRLSDSELSALTTNYTQFGGIPRYVLSTDYSGTAKTKKNPILQPLSMSALTQAFDDVGSGSLDHATMSGILVHLIPDTPYYNSFTYRWASTYIMMKSFDKLFNIKQKEIDCLLVTGEVLHLSTLYRLLFEPWFHRRVCAQGYKGRIRKLKPGHEMQGLTRRKRNKMGIWVDNLGITKYNIPKLEENVFFYRRHIRLECYNRPTSPNYDGVDSLCPHRGEIFQVTSTQSHPIKTKNLGLLRPLFDDFLAMNPKQRVKFIFVVLPSRFETFVKQTYVSPLESGRRDPIKSASGSQDDKPKSTSKEDKKLQMKSAEQKKEVKEKYVALKKESKKEQEQIREQKRRKKLIVAEPSDMEDREDDTYVNEKDESDPAWAELTEEVEEKFDDSWLEQWVLEMNVDPLTNAIAARNLVEKNKGLWRRLV
jgi:hypothetical protein